LFSKFCKTTKQNLANLTTNWKTKNKPTKNWYNKKYCLVKSFKQHYLTISANQPNQNLADLRTNRKTKNNQPKIGAAENFVWLSLSKQIYYTKLKIPQPIHS